MSSKMKVLTIQIDVSELSDSEIEDLQTAMEVQTEDTNAPILGSDVREIDIDELMEEDSSELH
jgi:ribosomal protein L12E/L44/L45/RPP1/RPP2